MRTKAGADPVRPLSPPLHLEVGSPLNQLGVWGSAASSHSGVQGKALAKNESGACFTVD